MSTTTDRRLGLTGGTQYKAPVTVVATTNVTQSGEQTIDGIALLAINASGVPDRVLCTAQTNAVNNGIWNVSTGSWTRSLDANGNYDFATGTQVAVARGSAANQIWMLTTANPITIGTSSLSYASVLDGGFLAWHAVQALNVKADYDAVGDGVTDDAPAINAAIVAANAAGGGTVIIPGRGSTYKVASQLVLLSKVRLIGEGYSENHGTAASDRGATCILRAFTGAAATLLVSGDDCGIDMIDFDNSAQGTGECVQVTGSRVDIGAISTRNSGGDGLRLGKTDSGASSTNTNAWSAQKIITCGNALAGMRLDDTNTTTSPTYPLGLANVNAGYCGLVDARSNGTDGLQLGNCNDNVFSMVVSQSNTGCGIRFKTDGTNSGPRCNKILGNDCEVNTGNDIQIDAATLPASGPGLYNMVFGNRSVTIASRIVDNSTGSLVMQWIAGLGFRAYHFGSDVNALATSGPVGYNAYVGANNAAARVYGVASGAVDSILRGSVHKNGGSQTDGWELNQNAVFQPLNDQVTQAYSASITIDASTGHLFDISANNGTAFTINAPINPYTGEVMCITLRNTSGGALGAATWNAVFKMSAWTNPANGFSRSITFKNNGTNWVQISQTGVDVPN